MKEKLSAAAGILGLIVLFVGFGAYFIADWTEKVTPLTFSLIPLGYYLAFAILVALFYWILRKNETGLRILGGITALPFGLIIGLKCANSFAASLFSNRAQFGDCVIGVLLGSTLIAIVLTTIIVLCSSFLFSEIAKALRPQEVAA